jgi:hypothetical protein
MIVRSAVVANLKNFKIPAQVVHADIARMRDNAGNLKKKAMQLTDSWEGVMFSLTKEIIECVALAVGFEPVVAENIHSEITALNYAKSSSKSAQGISMATWHSADASMLTLRGIKDLDTAFSAYNDGNLMAVLDANQDTFQRIISALPDYAAQMNFKPETAANVLKAFGADVSADLLYEIAVKYNGATSCIDIEGRRGINVAFIRAMTLTLVATLN